MAIPTITPAPTPAPNRNTDTQAEFSTNVDNQLSWQRGFTTEINTTVAAIDSTASTVSSDAASALSSKNAAETAQGLAEDAQVAAELAETNAGILAAGIQGTSTTSNIVGTGTKTFTTQSGKQFTAGMYLLVVRTSDASTYLYGTVNSYTSTTLEMNILSFNGSGTYTDWSIFLSGLQGPQGNDGDLTAVIGDPTPQLGGALDTNNYQVQLSKGADVASASTLVLGSDGNYFDVTGTTTITAIDIAGRIGTTNKLHFNSALTIQHHATDLILLGFNLAVPSGSVLEFTKYDTDKVRLTGYVVSGFPAGGIIMWSGSIVNIPNGWAICDGTNGTPNLRDRFVIGAGSTYAVDASGGSKDAVNVSHTHGHSLSTASAGGHQHTISTSESGGTGGVESNLATTADASTSFTGDHSHSLTGSITSAGESGTDKNLPPYYALAFIMWIGA